jgi:hypothetical protein
LRALGTATSVELENVLLKALAVDPKDRYRSSGEFWDALGAAIREQATLPAGALSAAPRVLVRANAGSEQPVAQANTELASTTHSDIAAPASPRPRPRVLAAIGLGIGIFALLGSLYVFYHVWHAVNTESQAAVSSAEAIVPTRAAAQASSVPSAAASGAGIAPVAIPHVTLEGAVVRDIPSGRVGKDGPWLMGFRTYTPRGVRGLTFNQARATCNAVGKSLCTETQWARACDAENAVAAEAAWTTTPAPDGIVVRGGGSCGTRVIVAARSTEPARVGLCCDRAVALDLSGYNLTTLTNLSKRLLELELVINQRDSEAFAAMVSNPVKLQGRDYSPAQARAAFYHSSTENLDERELVDSCEIDPPKQTYTRTRRRRARRVEHVTWSATCTEVRARNSQIAAAHVVYTLDEGLKFKSLGAPQFPSGWLAL